MSPRKRNSENVGLPKGWRFKNGRYRYQVPAAVREHWDGKTEFTLGKTLSEAHEVFAKRIKPQEGGLTMAELFDKYLVEVTPTKSVRTRLDEPALIVRLKGIFGDTRASALQPHHIYAVYEALQVHGLTTANRHMEKLSHCFTMGIKWAFLHSHPMTNRKFVKTKPAAKRLYITDDQVNSALELAPPMIQAYVRLKLMVGLRMTDMLLLRWSDWKEDGLHCTPQKTALTSNKSLVFSRTPEIEDVIESLREKDKINTWLFHTQEGRCYVGMNKKSSGFNSAWQRWMKKVKDAGLTTFTERQMRVKAGSDAESDQQASEVLAHTTTATTKKHYRAKPNVVKPLKTSINRN